MTIRYPLVSDRSIIRCEVLYFPAISAHILAGVTGSLNWISVILGDLRTELLLEACRSAFSM